MTLMFVASRLLFSSGLSECGIQALLDRGAYYVLDGLGRQTYLTDFEEKLLSLLEQEHGIDS
ncbi:MAG: hypothetical protein N4J56_006548 [Chroococcidiopsis sp. SAG 2025]|uniref:hypothetical protein n=1 Tax=Chroococcidiopsis sp. SAG 2025 TaxID=171389 RepID=UPI002936FE75|nr:hypothetical protein [Chroococcidiopsis sp. SAG 2025]MDV2996843.1 hypothetical protein [Chroococcidiopsis sp. SAG 2025]